MKTLNIEIMVSGKTESDIDAALDEAVSKIKDGFILGGDSNEDGNYYYNVNESGEFEDEET